MNSLVNTWVSTFGTSSNVALDAVLCFLLFYCILLICYRWLHDFINK